MGVMVPEAQALEILERDLLLTSLSRGKRAALGSQSARSGADLNSLTREITDLVRLVARGQYARALQTRGASRLLLNRRIDAEDRLPEAAAEEFFDDVINVVQGSGRVSDSTSSTQEKESQDKWGLLVMATGVAALFIFVQANLTGPKPAVLPCPGDLHRADVPMPDIQEEKDKERHPWDAWANRELMVDGTDPVGKYRLPQYLVLANLLLRPDRSDNAASRWPRTAAWWAMRVMMTHQRMLAERSISLRKSLLPCTRKTLDLFGSKEAIMASGWGGRWTNSEATAVAAAAHLEAGLMEHAFAHLEAARSCFDRAAAICQLEISLTGAMGFRTIHQIDAKAQMVLQVSSPATWREEDASDYEGEGDDEALPPGTISEVSAASSADLPDGQDTSAATDVDFIKGAEDASAGGPMFNGDSEILLRPRLVELGGAEAAATPVAQVPAAAADVVGTGGSILEGQSRPVERLRAVEQAVVLALSLDVRKSNPQDELRSWQMAPYIEAVGSQPQIRPMVRAAYELLRVRWERSRPRTRERALATMEQLVDALRAGQDGAAARMQYAFSIWLPTWAALQKEYGEILLANGLMGDALRIFEQLELWDNLIECYRLLGKPAAAADLVRERLLVQPEDPRLWSSLGDLAHDDECYTKAWDFSKGRYARAQRSLARSAYNRGDYVASIAHWKLALGINPLHPDGWFSYGYAAVKAGEFQVALQAFSRSVQLDPDNGESWNNIAALNIRRKRSHAAFKALQEALKFKRDSWQTWENFTQVSLDVRNYAQAVHAMKQVLELTKDKRVDIASLARLVAHVEAARGVACPSGVPEAAPGGDPAIDGRQHETDALQEEEDDEEFPMFADLGPMRLPGGNPVADGSAATSPRAEINSMCGELPAGTPRENRDEPGEVTVPRRNEPGDISTEGHAVISSTGGPDVAAKRARDNLEGEVRRLLGRVAASGTGGAEVWSLQARFLEAVGEPAMAAEALVKLVRSLQGSSWHRSEDKFLPFARASLQLCHAHLATARRVSDSGASSSADVSTKRRALSAARLHLRNVLRQGEQFKCSSEYRSLETCLEEVLTQEALLPNP